jgi:hypothetical protein
MDVAQGEIISAPWKVQFVMVGLNNRLPLKTGDYISKRFISMAPVGQRCAHRPQRMQ